MQLFYAAEETRHGPSHGGAVQDHVEVTKLNHGSLHGNLYKNKKNCRRSTERLEFSAYRRDLIIRQSTMQSPALSAYFFSGLNVRRKNKM